MLYKFFFALVTLVLFQFAGNTEAAKYACQETEWGGKNAKFVMLKEDEVNFREQPENGKILRSFDNHTLLRVIREKGKWLWVETPFGTGYVFTAKTGPVQEEELIIEDFDLKFVDLNAPYFENEIEQILGRHLSKQEEKGRLTVNYEKMRLVVDKKGYIVEMYTEHDSFNTMRGVGVGDPEYRLVGQYGAPATVEYGDTESLYTYYCRLNQNYLYSMSFAIDRNNKLKSITWSVVEKPANEKKAKLKKTTLKKAKPAKKEKVEKAEKSLEE